MSNAQLVLDLYEQALGIDHAEKQAAYDADHPDGKTNPSVSDFGACPRKVWYSLNHFEESNRPDIQSLANFFFGHAIEDAVARLFELVGVKTQREIRVILGSTTGRLDFLLEIPEANIIVELKSSKTKQSYYLPQEQHVHQLNGYLEAFAREGKDYQGVLAYIIKDATRGKQVMYAFDVERDPVMAAIDITLNNDILLFGDIPPNRPKGYLKSKFPCSYCSYKDACWT